MRVGIYPTGTLKPDEAQQTVFVPYTSAASRIEHAVHADLLWKVIFGLAQGLRWHAL